MTTAKKIFEKAISIIDELSDAGTVSDTQVKEYKARAPYLLDMWQREIARLENIEITKEITSLDQEVQISDKNCPSGAYYLAEHFALADQNDSLASMCRTKFLILKGEAIKPLECSGIVDVYNVNCGPY